jgi:hypothetical protein
VGGVFFLLVFVLAFGVWLQAGPSPRSGSGFGTVDGEAAVISGPLAGHSASRREANLADVFTSPPLRSAGRSVSQPGMVKRSPFKKHFQKT